MPYTQYTLDENALQAMAGMKLPKCYVSVILGTHPHPGSIYRELNRNSTGGVYTGNEAQQASAQRRLDNKPSIRLDDHVLHGKSCVCSNKTCPRTRFQVGLGRYTQIGGKTGFTIDHLHLSIPGNGKRPGIERAFPTKPHHRKGAKDCRGQIRGRVSVAKRPQTVEEKFRAGDWEGDRGYHRKRRQKRLYRVCP
jgi:IS30 family transposase